MQRQIILTDLNVVVEQIDGMIQASKETYSNRVDTFQLLEALITSNKLLNPLKIVIVAS